MTSGKVTKVLHLQTSLNLTCGITRYLQSLHNNHVDEFHMTVLCYDGDAVENLRENGVDVKLFNSSLTWYYLLSNLLQIIRIVKNSNISIIHSHHRWLDVLGSISAKLCGISSIMTCHSIVSGKKFLSYRSDRIIAVSSAVYANLTEDFGVNPSRIILLRNGIDPSVYKKDNLSYTGIKNNAMGFVGRLTRDKGFDIFLSVGERILEINSEIKLIIAGDGELKEAISSLSTRYPSQVIYKGVVKNIESVYSEISFLIMPSELDSFPYVVLEAGLFSLVVIASSTGGIPEIIEDGIDGRLIGTRTPDDFFKEVLYVLNNRAVAERWSVNLFKKVSQNFSFSSHARKLESIYKKLNVI